MLRMKIKTLYIGTLVLLLTIVGSIYVYQQTFAQNKNRTEILKINDELKEKKQAITDLNKQIDKFKKEIKQKEQQVASLGNQISILDSRIQKTNLDIKARSLDIESKKLEIKTVVKYNGYERRW